MARRVSSPRKRRPKKAPPTLATRKARPPRTGSGKVKEAGTSTPRKGYGLLSHGSRVSRASRTRSAKRTPRKAPPRASSRKKVFRGRSSKGPKKSKKREREKTAHRRGGLAPTGRSKERKKGKKAPSRSRSASPQGKPARLEGSPSRSRLSFSQRFTQAKARSSRDLPVLLDESYDPSLGELSREDKARERQLERTFESQLAKLSAKNRKLLEEIDRERKRALAEVLASARRDEKRAHDRRIIERAELVGRESKKNSLHVYAKERAALEELLEIHREAARRLGLESSSVRGYAYRDGTVVVTLKVPSDIPIIDIEMAMRGNRSVRDPFLPKGAYIEANADFEPAQLISANKKKDLSPLWRNRGKERLQMWGSQNSASVFLNLELTLRKMMLNGYPPPESYTFRTALTPGYGASGELEYGAGTQPFYRHKPPKGGSRVRLRMGPEGEKTHKKPRRPIRKVSRKKRTR